MFVGLLDDRFHLQLKISQGIRSKSQHGDVDISGTFNDKVTGSVPFAAKLFQNIIVRHRHVFLGIQFLARKTDLQQAGNQATVLERHVKRRNHYCLTGYVKRRFVRQICVSLPDHAVFNT